MAEQTVSPRVPAALSGGGPEQRLVHEPSYHVSRRRPVAGSGSSRPATDPWFDADPMKTPPQLRWILAFLLLVVFPASLWWANSTATNTGLRDLRERGSDTLNLFRFSLQGELERFEFLPRILAQNKDVVKLLRSEAGLSADEAMNRYLQRFNEISGASDTYVMDRTGLTVAASNWNSPRPFVGRRFAFRPYFQQAMAGQAGRYFALGTTSQRRGFYFSFPVRDGEEVIGVTVVKVSAERLESLITFERGEVLVTDAEGVIFLSTQPEWVFRTLRPLDPQVRRELQASRQYGEARLLALPVYDEEYREDRSRLLSIGSTSPGAMSSSSRSQQVRYLVQTSQVPYANWIIHLLTDTAPVERQAMAWMVGVGVLMAILVLTGGFLYQRRINWLVRQEYQRRAHQALEESEANTRSIISRTRAGLITTDAEGRIDFLNPTAEKLFGYAASEVVGRPVGDLFNAPDTLSIAEWSRLAHDSDTTYPEGLETEARRADGHTFPVEMAVSVMRRREGERFLVTIHDLTERKRAEAALREAHDALEQRVRMRTADLLETNRRLEEEIGERKRAEAVLRRAQDELVQAAKLATIGQMSAGVTHELNQPLAAIRSYADNARVLLERSRVEDAVANLESIVELTDRMAEITRTLKSFARKSSGKAVPVSLGEVVDHALAVVTSHTRMDGYRIHRSDPGFDVRVMGDGVRLQQVALNLIKNAIDAMADAERREIHLAIRQEGGMGLLEVRDTGNGIDEDKLDAIFDPFFTTKEVGEGLGLGLSISNGIVRGYQGTIQVANHPDGGCVFTVRLPLDPGVLDADLERIAAESR